MPPERSSVRRGRSISRPLFWNVGWLAVLSEPSLPQPELEADGTNARPLPGPAEAGGADSWAEQPPLLGAAVPPRPGDDEVAAPPGGPGDADVDVEDFYQELGGEGGV